MGTEDGQGVIRIWDIRNGSVTPLITSQTGRNTQDHFDLAWHPDGVRLAVGHRGSQCVVWDTRTGTPLFTPSPRTEGGPLRAVAWSPDGKRLAAAHVPIMVVYDESGKALFSLPTEAHLINSLRWSPDGRLLLSGSSQGVDLWDGASGRHAQRLRIHGNQVVSVSWGPDSKRFLSGSYGSIKIAEVGKAVEQVHVTRLQEATLPGRAPYSDLAWSPSGRWLACGMVAACYICDGRSGQLRHTLPAEPSCWSLAWSPDSASMMTLHYHDRATVWNPRTGKAIRTLRIGDKDVFGSSGLAWSPKGNLFATANWKLKGGATRLWSASAWEPVATLSHDPGDHQVAFSPDGLRLAAGGSEGLSLWGVAGKKRLYLSPTGRIDFDVSWSPNGRLIAGASPGGVVLLVRASDGRLLHRARGHRGAVTRVRWSPDGRRFATASADRTVKVWDAATADTLITFPCEGAAPYGLAWSPDGRRLACTCEDGTLRIWGTPNMKIGLPDATGLETGVLAAAMPTQ